MTVKAQAGPAAEPAHRDDLLDGPIPPRRLSALSRALLLIDDAHLYGLIDGDPGVDRDRCREVVQELRRQGCFASPEEVEEAVLGLMCALGAVRE